VLLIITGLLVAGVGVWWLVGRMAVGSLRHALNHQEGPKDILWRDITAGCAQVNGGQVFIWNGSPRYIQDRFAISNDVYRYIVVDSAALADSACLSAVVTSAWRAKYPVSMAVSSNGLEVAYFHFTPGEK